SPSSNFLQIVNPSKSCIKIGDQINLELKATEPIGTLFYQIMGLGNILLTDGVAEITSSSASVSIKVTEAMAPKTRVVAFYIRKDNQEIVADAINLHVEGVFKTPVTVDTSSKQSQPGE